MNGKSRGRRALTVVAAAIAVLSILAVASPALGGPSLTKVAKSAKKALKTAKAANKRSKKALNASKQPGPTGPRGPQGPRGATGRNAATSAVVRVNATTISAPGETVESVTRACNAGERAVGGGARWTTTPVNFNMPIVQSYASNSAGTPTTNGGSATAWTATGGNNTGTPQSLEVHVVCVSP